jgi:hypothetical protein
MMAKDTSTWAALLLADPSPCLRSLVLSELLEKRDDDPEIVELSILRDSDPLVVELLELQGEDGSWKTTGSLGQSGLIQGTALALAQLGYKGFDKNHPAVQRGAEFLFAHQERDGSWPMSGDPDDSERDASKRLGNYSMMPLQTSFPLRGLAVCGYATDPRAESAYDWLLEQRLPDGAWPTGVASGVFGYVAGYRRLAHSRWGCRSNTTGALSCLALHPNRRSSEEAKRALDLLLGRETRERSNLGFEVARLTGYERPRGFLTFFARFDPAQIIDLCWRVGASRDDERVVGLVDFVLAAQGSYGLWEYLRNPGASRWVTFDLLRSLTRLDDRGEWLSLEPRTPFRAYGKRITRY